MSYAWRIWDHWERHLDPELPTDANLRRVLQGLVVVITGASSGIGRAVALRVAGAGATTVLVSRGREKLDEVRAEIDAAGGRATVHPTDLSDVEACREMVRTVLADHGRIDVLVNNAGRSIRRAVLHSLDRFHDFERTMQLNYFGAIACILEVIPGMRERGRGQIINISSIGAQTYPPRFAAYVASKAALDAFSRCLAPEVAGDGVAITEIHMPLVRTPMIAPTKIYDRLPTLTPEQAAGMITEAIRKRPKKIATTLGNLGQLTYAIAPGAQDMVVNRAYQLFPESGAPVDRRTEAEQRAFAQATRGVHW
jgi:NAD(P)-dependent dehydrogenase (short-subunit alcohol dehydrogenase family)